MLFLLSSLAQAVAQDPAHGWMAYAVGKVPAGVERITRLEMTWTVSQNPKLSGAFFSPWFGMDPADNLNLIQPVNPWSGSIFGGEWSMYTEYYQWSPTHNSNSRQVKVSAGQNLHGSIVYQASTDSYIITQTVVETGKSSSQTVKAQNGKKYKLPYVVYEKKWPCRDYPPDGEVVFRDIIAECDEEDCTNDIAWEALVEDENCDMAAHINTDGTISITWNTSVESKYDNYTRAELYDINMAGVSSWPRKLGIERPRI